MMKFSTLSATVLMTSVLMFSSTALSFNEFNDHYFNTKSSDLTPHLHINKALDYNQISTFFGNIPKCLTSPTDIMLYSLSETPASLVGTRVQCHIDSGTWLDSLGNKHLSSSTVEIAPLWNSVMVSRHFDYSEKTTKTHLLSSLYDANNWLIVPSTSFTAVRAYFPLNQSATDVSACKDLETFTTFGLTNQFRFSRELTNKISSLEQLSGCSSLLTLDKESAIQMLNNEQAAIKEKLEVYKTHSLQ